MKKIITGFALFAATFALEASYSFDHYAFDDHSVHLVTFDPDEYSIKLIDCQGLKALEEMTTESDALIGINGGFYRADGSPAGVFYTETTKDMTAPGKLRGAIAWDEDFHVKFGRTATITDEWKGYPYVLGGAPLLLLDGEIQDFRVEETLESFLTLPHARIAIGVNDQGQVILAMAEGISRGAVGFSMIDWANWLKEMGVVHALNLCGGHSSSLFVEGEIFTEGEAKKVGNVVVVVEKK